MLIIYLDWKKLVQAESLHKLLQNSYASKIARRFLTEPGKSWLLAGAAGPNMLIQGARNKGNNKTGIVVCPV